MKKSIYGVRQSGRLWYHTLKKFLIREGFTSSFVDNCLYTKHVNNEKLLIIVWVDDIIIAASNTTLLNSIKNSFCNRFKTHDLDQLSYFLGIQFKFHDNCITMDQTSYLKNVLSQFNMSNCQDKPIPCDLSVNKSNKSDSSSSKELDDPKLFREIIGRLIYAMTNTRPDLCYAVTKLSQHLNKPTYANLNMTKFILKYVKASLDYNLCYSKTDSDLKLNGYCNSDWGGSQDRKSISGYCFMFNSNALISWKSRKQNIVALSTCEAEYVALTAAIQESNFLNQLYRDMQNTDKLTVPIFVDNQGAIALAQNHAYHQRSKHISIKYHYIRSEIQNLSVSMHYFPSAENKTDIFTKPSSKQRFNQFKCIRGYLCIFVQGGVL